MNGLGYRRGSIFWALTLIAIGGIFLYSNFEPAIRPWQMIARFWPIVIIFWGLSKLMDYLHAQAHPELPSPSLFTVSEVILLVLVLALGTLVSKIVLHPWQHWPEAVGIEMGDEFSNIFLNSYTYTQTLSQSVKPQSGLLVVVRRGDVEVRGADQNTMEAVVKKTIRAANEEDAKKTTDALQISFVEQAGRYLLETNLDSLPNNGRNVRLDITLRVPRALAAEINTERGDIVLEGLKGDQTLTARGDVRLANVEGLVRIHKAGGSAEIRDVKGNVDVDGQGRDIEASGVTGALTVSGEFSGSMQFKNVTQTLRFNSSRTDLTVQKLTGRLNMERDSLDATGVEGPFEISTKHKDISLGDFKHSVKISTTNGDVRLETSVPPAQPIEVEVNKGGIDLTLPAKSSFQIEASSRHGEVECDFPGLTVNKEAETPTIAGTFGKGGPTIRLSTSYGSVRLMRQGLSLPTPPQPPAPPKAPASAAGDEADEEIAWAQPPALCWPAAAFTFRLPAGVWLRRVASLLRSVNGRLLINVSQPALDWMRGAKRCVGRA
jgi:DUF4097 and DUF4098 domain-containing protein YvlB